MDPNETNSCGLSRHHIMQAAEDSLKRLQTTYIDLYQVSISRDTITWCYCIHYHLLKTHCWDAGTCIEDTLHALNDLVRAGKIHYIGVSNVLGWQLQKIVDTNKKFGYPQIVSLQVGLLVYVVLGSFTV